ncbi:NAF1-domain-containing protein [Guyanagaster necrorhizus]|uniref:H/ACA ribonucleoprotein complex non-core subunit NAF1 n=1 Tax=Guyanagaster necrorhizus TaxID=856835 RepID=A0A9P8AYJ1_9AGAR|nr:NAF1-domain-containing protein [Guyanagaster necrorhizus MCA 3950]KAG7452271.1 NAF1-domain-containing protein [Guyanagaster necrorhizus MCA 3950]
MDIFKTPGFTSQDLLLIQSLLGAPSGSSSNPPLPVQSAPIKDSDEDISSSSSEHASEDEIEDVLIIKEEDEEMSTKNSSENDALVKQDKAASPIDAKDSESDDSSSSEEGEEQVQLWNENDDDEEPGLSTKSQSYFTSQHEVVDTDISVPEIAEVGAEEAIEILGEIVNIMDQAVIIEGLPSSYTNHVLDSETLLVFDDRKVLGYIYETFGPTAQPLYQVKFNSAFPLDTDKIKLARQVFHVPGRSRFVAIDSILIKGSDASNVYDEEPTVYELEFSDDEAEVAHKRKLKYGRRSRVDSVASTSFASPMRMRDQDMMTDAFGSNSAYDDHSPYDPDYSASTATRPPPMPYDEDPYADVSLVPSSQGGGSNLLSNILSGPAPSTGKGLRPPHRDRRGRGQARGRRQQHEAISQVHAHDATNSAFQYSAAEYNAYQQAAMVQPHINPRFAAAFGMAGMAYPHWQNPYTTPEQYWSQGWGAGGGYGPGSS